MENLAEQTLFSSEFNSKQNELTILDVCSGNIGHLNLKKVAFLESNLCELYQKLTRLNESLKTYKNATTKYEEKYRLASAKSTSANLPFHEENLKAQLDVCMKATNESCANLFDLCLLVPTAPWVILKPFQLTNPFDNGL